MNILSIIYKKGLQGNDTKIEGTDFLKIINFVSFLKLTMHSLLDSVGHHKKWGYEFLNIYFHFLYESFLYAYI
jgi:hypothetical protein